MEFDRTFFDDLWNTLEGVFRGRIANETRNMWQMQLSHFSHASLLAAITAICKEQDKMPSLAQIMRYTRTKLPFTHVPRHRVGVDRDGVACWYFEAMRLTDKANEPHYAANDCPEGREFLSKLRQVAMAKQMPQEKSVQELERELARQKRAAR